MVFQRNQIVAAIAALLLANSAHAEAADSPAASTAELQAVTVIGTRTAAPTDQVPRSIDVVDESAIDLNQSADLGEVLDTLPNVSLTGSPRPSGELIQIRGLSGQRVLTLVDGVREDFSKGHLSGVFIDPDLLKQVEVQRGPASVLWGSGAVGGVLSVQTRDAADLLQPDRDFGARLKTAYQSATQGWLGSATVYGRKPGVASGLLSVTYRDNSDLRLGGGTTLPHSAYRQGAILAKATLTPGTDHLLRVSHRRHQNNGVTPSNPAALLSRENPLLERHVTEDTSQIEWQWAPPSSAVDLQARIYRRDARVNEDAAEFTRHDRSSVRSHGFGMVNTSRFDLGSGGAHALTYGVDGFSDRAAGLRDGAPRPEFPDAKRTVWSAFAQDQVSWGAWTASAGLRYDRYQSKSRRSVAADQSQSHLSYQAGLVWQATDWLSAYASYAQAFRAPSIDQLYPSGTHFGANRFVPNPLLKPERAANKEVGIRAQWQDVLAAGDQLELSSSVFRNDVRDFIDSIVTVTRLPGPPYVGGTTRNENVTSARLQGFELGGQYLARQWLAGLSYGQTRGTNTADGQPLADIAPGRWVLRAGLRNLPGDGQILLRGTFSQRQDRVPEGTDPTAGYAVFDLLASWSPRKNMTVGFAVGNLADKAYRRHNAVINEAGRNFKASLTWQF